MKIKPRKCRSSSIAGGSPTVVPFVVDNEQCKLLIQQGKFLKMSLLEKTLPTHVNLKKWGKVSSDKCKLCKRWSLPHILNRCEVALNQSCFTWRHNGVLSFLNFCIDRKPDLEVYFNLPNHQTVAGGGTIPPNLPVTAQKPNLVLMRMTW